MALPDDASVARGVITKGSSSPLELFHPEGKAGGAIVIGNNYPRYFIPVSAQADSVEASVIVWAPTWAECQEPGWLERSAILIDQTLSSEGVIYGIVPRRWRRKARRILKAHNLQPGTYIAHLPNWSSSRYLVPLKHSPAQYAFLNMFPTRDAIRILALAILHLPSGDNFLGALIPWAGFTAQRVGSRVPFDWLYRLVRLEPGDRNTIFSTSWRKERCSIVMHSLRGDAPPTFVAKTVWSRAGDNRPSNEFENLSTFGEAARHAGARVPQPIHCSTIGGSRVFLQSVLEGRSAAAVLSGHPERILEIMAPVVNWLTAWNQATRILLPLSGKQLERDLLEPARNLTPLLPGGEVYCAWLTQESARVTAPVPFVAAHHDLTLWNILLQPGNPPGIVDWSEACAESLPLTDLFYAMVDAVTIAHQVTSERAFQECFFAQGWYFPLTKKYLTQMREALDIPKGVPGLCLHACFLHHVLNEQHDQNSDDPHPFLGVLRRLVQNREILGEF